MCYFVVVVELHCFMLYQMIMTLSCGLPGNYAGSMVHSYRSFGTTYRFHLERPRILSCTASHSQRNCIQWTSSSLNMKQIASPETSARNYQCSLCNNAEEGSPHLLRGGSQITRIVMTLPINRHTLLFLYHNFY
jgi:hypothetical protein